MRWCPACCRDTLAAHWWTDKQGIIGGRDCLGKGTWLCAGVNGRVAFLTNVRNRRSLSLNGSGPTRGELPVQFVSEVAPSPEAFLQGIDVEAYSPFNLIVADLSARPEGKSQVWYLTNSPGDGPSQANEAFNLEEGVSNAAPQQVNPGTHGVSNASLDTPWPKVTLGRRRFDELAGRGAFDGDEFPFEEVFGVMLDSKVLETDPDKLPNTGYPPALEAAASAIFVDPVQYGPCVFGTRSTTGEVECNR